MNRRAAVYSASRSARKVPAGKHAAPAAAAPAPRTKTARWYASRRLQWSAAATVLLIGFVALWLARPAALTQQQVEAVVHRAISEIPAVPTATEAYEKIRPAVVAVRGAPDDGEE